MIKLKGRLDRPPSPIAIIHVGRRQEGERYKQDVSYKKNPRFVITHYKQDLRFGEHAPIHEEIFKLACDRFAEGDPMKLTTLPLTLINPMAESVLNVNKMNSCGFKQFDCVHHNPADCGTDEDPKLVDLAKIEQYKTQVVPIEVRPGMPNEWHHGDVAHRTIGRDKLVVPCPSDPHDCPFGRELDIDKQSGKPKEWNDGSPKYIHSCNLTGILHASIKDWYPKSSGYVQLWTKSWPSVRDVSLFLNKAEWFWGKLGMSLNLIKVLLSVERALIPDPNGERKPQPVLSMDYSPEYAQIVQKALSSPRMVLQLSSGKLDTEEALFGGSSQQALNPGTYVMEEEHEDVITLPPSQQPPDKEYTIKKDAPPTRKQPPESPPQNTDGQEQEIKGKDLLALKKLAEGAGRMEEFIAAQGKMPKLIELRNSLSGTPPPAQPPAEGKTPPPQQPPIVENVTESGGVEPSIHVDPTASIDEIFDAMWKIHGDAFKFPKQEKAIKLILMLGKNVALPSKLSPDNQGKLREEFEIIDLFAGAGGTLEEAAKITGENGFVEKGWFTGAFIDKRRQAANALLDREV